MKVSKVDHTRIGTKLYEPAKGKGILYRSQPGEKEAVPGLESRINDLRKKANSFYQVLKTGKQLGRGKEEKEQVKKLISSFNKAALLLAEKRHLNQESSSFLIDYAKRADIAPAGRELTNRIVDTCLRGSLRRSFHVYGKSYYFPDIVKDVLFAFAAGRDSDAAEILSYVIEKDYYQDSGKLAESIEQKDVRVQVSLDAAGRCLLMPSNASHPKKQYIFDFMKKFASADSEGRAELLAWIKGLILLYFTGSRSSEDLSAWTWGSAGLDSEMDFIPEIQTDISDLTAVESELTAFYSRLSELKEKSGKGAKQSGRRWNDPEERALQDEIKQKKDVRDALKTTIRRKIHDGIALHYRNAADGITGEERFWIQFFESFAEKTFSSPKSYAPFKIKAMYLCDSAWKSWQSFMAMKFVDMGKAVYHFVLPDFFTTDMKSGLLLGEVKDSFRAGITSFDYERIKAEEGITRAIANYTTFAVGIFANAAVKPEYRSDKSHGDALLSRSEESHEDVLLYRREELPLALREGVHMRLLAYFGGKSSWEDSYAGIAEGEELFEAVRDALYFLRNKSYHYADNAGSLAQESIALLRSMLEKEVDESGVIFRKKYASNNVPVFYPVEQINGLMDNLYRTGKGNAAQVPSFSCILKKKELPEFLKGFVEARYMANIPTTNGWLEKYRSSMYFMLKEIYYYGFLNDPELNRYFKQGIEGTGVKPANKEAFDDFSNRVREITGGEDLPLGYICQQLMTDCNQQNQTYRVKSGQQEEADRAKGKGRKYQHFKMLLYVSIRNAFEVYLIENAEKYEFLKTPGLKTDFFETDAGKDFENGWKTDCFSELKDAAVGDQELLAWYTLAHFLPPKWNNHLQGDIKGYIQFTADIERRSHLINGGQPEQRASRFEQILKVLEFVMLKAGGTSNVLTDYFADSDEYADYLFNFVQFVSGKESRGRKKTSAELRAFCDQTRTLKGYPSLGPQRYGVYYDAMNPVLNRNVVNSLLFGETEVLSKSFNAVKDDDFVGFMKLKASLARVLSSGTCTTKAEQKQLQEYKNRKNRIELLDVSIFNEILSDYLAQLVTFAYFRERDMMYYQLGYYYVRLFHTDSVPADSFLRVLEGEEVDIRDGAVLYQLAALYTHDLPVYVFGNDGRAKASGKTSAGASISSFVKGYCGEKMDKAQTYFAGLELFEDISCHDRFTSLRNEINHLKYLAKPQKSILDLYSDVYNGFFRYDTKLRKSISFIFSNILMKYFVIVDTRIKAREEEVLAVYPETGDKRRKNLNYAQFQISKLRSDVFTYKDTDKGEQKYTLEVRHKVFLDGVKRALEYKSRE